MNIFRSKIVVYWLKKSSQNSRVTCVVKFLFVANANQRTVIGEQFKSCTHPEKQHFLVVCTIACSSSSKGVYLVSEEFSILESV